MERFRIIVRSVREQFSARLGKIVALLVLLFLFSVAIGGASHHERWRIEQVDISGVSIVSTDQMRELVTQKLAGNYFFVYARENSHLFPEREIEQALLDTFPRLEQVSVARVNDHTIAVVATERKPYALWCGEQLDTKGEEEKECWFVDKTGFIFDRAPVFSRGVYIEIYGRLTGETSDPLRSIIPHERFVLLDSYIKQIFDHVGRPYRIILKPQGEVELTLFTSEQYPFLSNTSLRFKEATTPENVVKRLTTAIPVQFPENVPLKKKLQYIDMRFGNKVIFGFDN